MPVRVGVMCTHTGVAIVLSIPTRVCPSVGSESDIVIFSAVRSKPLEDISNLPPKQVDRQWRMENLGFVAEPHHLCVALTRARFGLIILG